MNTLRPKLVAREGIEPPTPAYETGKIPFLYLAINLAESVGIEPTHRITTMTD